MGVLFFLVVLFLVFGGFGVIGQIFGLFFGIFGGLLGLFFSFFFTVLPFLILFKVLHVIFGGHRHKAWVHAGPHAYSRGNWGGHWGSFCSDDDNDDSKLKNEEKRKRDAYYGDPNDPYQQDVRIV
jgi:hypothetical protein